MSKLNVAITESGLSRIPGAKVGDVFQVKSITEAGHGTICHVHGKAGAIWTLGVGDWEPVPVKDARCYAVFSLGQLLNAVAIAQQPDSTGHAEVNLSNCIVLEGFAHTPSDKTTGELQFDIRKVRRV